MTSHSSSLIILGSARSSSNTLRAVQSIFGNCDTIKFVDLKHLNISPYSYGNESDDDFLKVINRMTEHRAIVFATPVYWYAMSGTMKIFFDRLTDLITRQKQLGRAVAGKYTFLIATGTDPELPEGFEVPFRRTSEYFSMRYIQTSYFVCKGDAIIKEPMSINEFISEVKQCDIILR